MQAWGQRLNGELVVYQGMAEVAQWGAARKERLSAADWP